MSGCLQLQLRSCLVSVMCSGLARLFCLFSIDGALVESVSSFKFLGVMLRSDLSWSDQVDYVIKKTNSRLYALSKIKKAGLNVGDLVLYIQPLLGLVLNMLRLRGQP